MLRKSATLLLSLTPSPPAPPNLPFRRSRGSVVLLLNSGNPTPLHTWRLTGDTPTSLRLLLDSGGGREGVLCLTRRGELLMLSVASPAEDGGKALARQRQQQQQQQVRDEHGSLFVVFFLSRASERSHP